MRASILMAFVALAGIVSQLGAAENLKEGNPEAVAGKQVLMKVELPAQAGNARRGEYQLDETKTETIDFWFFLPSDESAKTDDGFPLMLFLHGAGERGDDPERVKSHGPAMLCDDPEVASAWKFITVSPQCKSGMDWSPLQMIKLIDLVCESYPVDRSRIYVTGLSMGGFGAWGVASVAGDKIAAVVPICGWYIPERAASITMPVWAFHGDKDPAVNIESGRRIVNAVRDAGNPDVVFTVYPGVEHNSWTQTYANPLLYDWLLSKRAPQTISGPAPVAGKQQLMSARLPAKTGNAFAGWFTDKACTKALNPKGYDNRNPTVKVVVLENDTTIYAKFVTAAEAKKSLKFSSATAKLAKTPAKATAGGKFSLKLGISSASLVTVTATGLPKGLKIDKATGAITGTATVVGDFTATVTVKDAAGNKITQKVKITARTASYAKGTFYGTAKPDGKTLSYLKFTVGSTGKVSGKVTYKGKAYSFTAKYKSCTATKATFAPTIKAGSKTFKPSTVTVKTLKVGGLSLVEAANSKATFAAQKKANLVKKGKALAKLVGKTFKFTKKTKNSGLTKSKDKLEVKLANGDAAKVTGVVGGKKLTAISWVTLVSDVTAESGAKVYTLYVDIIDAKLKYEKTLVITATVGSGGVKATAAFAK